MSGTIIILGCNGFIGSNLVNHFIKNKYNEYYVVGIDTDTYITENNFYVKQNLQEWKRYINFQYIHKDINDLKTLPNCDYVINLAANTHVDNSLFSQKEFIHSNILGIENILQLIKNKHSFDRPKLIHISTDEVYGDENIPVNGFTEEEKLNPSNPYSASKASADQLIIGYAKTFDINYVIIRPTNNYGVGQFPEKLISKNLKLLQQGKKITLYGEGVNKRYWLHVKDTCIAIKNVVDKYSNVDNVQDIFNISSDVIKTNKEVINQLIRSYLSNKYKDEEYGEALRDEDFKKFIVNVPERKREDKIYKLNSDKFRKEFNWKPEHSEFFEKNIIDIVTKYNNLEFII